MLNDDTGERFKPNQRQFLNANESILKQCLHCLLKSFINSLNQRRIGALLRKNLLVLLYTLLYFIILLHTSTYVIVLYCTQPADESSPKPKKQLKTSSSEFGAENNHQAKTTKSKCPKTHKHISQIPKTRTKNKNCYISCLTLSQLCSNITLS